jgi:hypothetical protein
MFFLIIYITAATMPTTSILIIANSQSGKQLEILQQVELKLGEQIQAIENGLKEAAPAEQNNKI